MNMQKNPQYAKFRDKGLPFALVRHIMGIL